MVGLEPVAQEMDVQLLRSMIERHRELTGSRRAAEILEQWDAFLPLFHKVVPHPSEATARPQNEAALEAEALRALAAEAHGRIQVGLAR
jgi:glutamate synthase domain-containing protein 3